MNNTLDLINDINIECSSFVGTLNGFTAVEQLAKQFSITSISYRAFLNGEISSFADILTLDSNEDSEHTDYSMASPAKERSIVLRIFRKKDAENLDEENAKVFNIFAKTILSAVTVFCLYKVRKATYLHDDIGLTNKNFYLEALEKIINENNQNEYYIGHVNIKNATKLNSIFGNTITDRIIIQYGIELSNKCNTEFNENASRLGGDNFAFVIHKSNIDAFIEFIKNVHISIDNGGDIIDYTLHCRAGIIQGDSNIFNAGELLSSATAVYKATRNPNNPSIIVSNSKSTSNNYESPTLLNELIFDLKSEKLLVYYQPIIKSNGSNEMVAAEALVRWRRSGELIMPNEFLPLAEKMGFITDIDLFVLKKGCQTLSKWISEGKKVVPISFNFSHLDFINDDIITDIIKIVDDNNIDHGLVIIELKEADYLEEHEILLNATNRLQEAGIKVSIDSFGSGYASISLLNQYDFNYLKLDASLVNDSGAKANTIIRNLINLAHELSIVVINKGINDEVRINEFKELGNHYFQSEYFEKPLSERFFANKLT